MDGLNCYLRTNDESTAATRSHQHNMARVSPPLSPSTSPRRQELHWHRQRQRTTNSNHKVSRLLLGGDARSVSAAPASAGLRPPSENGAVLKAFNHEVLVVKSRRETRGWESFVDDRRKRERPLLPNWIPRHQLPPVAASSSCCLLRISGPAIATGSFKGRSAPSIPDTLPAAMASLRSVCRAPLSQLARRTAATNHPRIVQRQWRGYATSLEAQQKVAWTGRARGRAID